MGVGLSCSKEVESQSCGGWNLIYSTDLWKKYINLVISSISGNESISYSKIWWPTENCLRSFLNYNALHFTSLVENWRISPSGYKHRERGDQSSLFSAPVSLLQYLSKYEHSWAQTSDQGLRDYSAKSLTS